MRACWKMDNALHLTGTFEENSWNQVYYRNRGDIKIKTRVYVCRVKMGFYYQLRLKHECLETEAYYYCACCEIVDKGFRKQPIQN